MTATTSAPDVWGFVETMWDPAPPAFMDDPVGWVEERIDGFLWSKQREVAESVRDNRYTAVPSCHAAGKSQLASFITAWWIDAHPPGEAIVVSTAPTARQVKNILWRYIGKVHRKAKLPGRVTQTEWYRTELDTHYKTSQGGEELVGFGAKPADQDPSAFQGIHAKYVLVIIDEAGGVEAQELWEAIDSLVTNMDCRVLAIGNPLNSASHFAEICKRGSGWNVIHIDGYDTPNLTGEKVPEWLRPLLIQPGWIQERINDWGEDSPVFIARVRGRFPEDNASGVIPLSWLMRCTIPREWSERELSTVTLGIDVGASDNGDQTVIRERTGPKAGRVWHFRERDHTKLAPKILSIIHQTGASTINIDAGGVGHGLANLLSAWGAEGRHRATVHEILFGSSATDNTRFINKRAEMFWGFRELVQSQAIDLSALTDQDSGDDTIADLTAPTWVEDTTGRTRVETKADIAARLKRSPDDGDATLLAFYVLPDEDAGFFFIEE